MNTQNKQEGFSPSLTTIRARTRRLLIDTAMSMYERGAFPSITEVVTNGAIVIHTQRLKSDPGGNLLS